MEVPNLTHPAEPSGSTLRAHRIASKSNRPRTCARLRDCAKSAKCAQDTPIGDEENATVSISVGAHRGQPRAPMQTNRVTHRRQATTGTGVPPFFSVLLIQIIVQGGPTHTHHKTKHGTSSASAIATFAWKKQCRSRAMVPALARVADAAEAVESGSSA